MNCYERKAFKRSQISLNNWKAKAKTRRYELEKVKLKIHDLIQSREIWKEKSLLAQNELNQIVPVSTDPHLQLVDNQKIQFTVISFCINLVINCSVSFSSVPKILTFVNGILEKLGYLFQFKIPHFTTVINWTLRLGKHLLKSALIPCSQPWICIIDHTIQIGTKKAFVVLKVLVDDIPKHGALVLKKAQVLCIKVQEKSNGEIIKTVLENIFQTVGYPQQIVMDGGSDLNKGVKLIANMIENPFKITYDLTHFMASLLKKNIPVLLCLMN